MQLYRILRRAFLEGDPFSGEGSFLYGGRWSSVGTRVSYVSTFRSLAVLEYRAHIDPAVVPLDLVITAIEVPDDVRIAPTPALPVNWRQSHGPETLRTIGDEFIARCDVAIMVVPSVILPEEHNALINPRHPEFRRFKRGAELTPFPFDTRLLEE